MRWVLAMLTTAIVVGFVAAGMGDRRDVAVPERDPGVRAPSPEVASELEDLRAGLRSGDEADRRTALDRIAEVGPRAAPLVDDVIRCLLWEPYMDSRANQQLARRLSPSIKAALYSMGEKAVQPIIDAVLQTPANRVGNVVFLTSDMVPDWISPSTGAFLVADLGGPAILPVAALLKDVRTCEWAHEALRYLALEEDIGPAVELVRRNLSVEADRRVLLASLGVAWLLRAEDRAELVPELTALVRDPRPEVQIRVVELLAEMGPDAQTALAALRAVRAATPPELKNEELLNALDQAVVKIQEHE